MKNWMMPILAAALFLSPAAFADETAPVATEAPAKVAAPKKAKKKAAPKVAVEEEAEATPVIAKGYRQNAVTFELLGRGFLYSVNYDFSPIKELAVGLGFSYFGSGSANLILVPVFVNFYPVGETHRLMLTTGPTFAMFSGKADSSSIKGSGVAYNIGVGYEHRGESGFIFRGGPYFYMGQIQTVWFGISGGFAF